MKKKKNQRALDEVVLVTNEFPLVRTEIQELRMHRLHE